MAYFYTNDVDDPTERLDYWRQLVSDSIVPLNVLPYQLGQVPSRFDGGIEVGRLADVGVATVTAAGHQVRRTPGLINARDDELLCVLLVANGSVRVGREDRRDVLHEGDLTLLNSSERYEMTFTGDHQVLCFHLPQQRIALAPTEMGQVTASRLSTDSGVGALMRPFLVQIARQTYANEVAAPQRLAGTLIDLTESLILERVGELQQHAETPRGLLLPRIHHDIDQLLGTPDLSAERLAAKHHISIDHLNRLFETDGVSVADWIKERRIEHCRRDLRDPASNTLAVSAIGARWGMPDAAAFEREFEARFHVPPHDYRLMGRIPHNGYAVPSLAKPSMPPTAIAAPDTPTPDTPTSELAS